MLETEILRRRKWRSGIIRYGKEVTGNMAKTCRYYGSSRTAFYKKWYERYEKYVMLKVAG